MVVFVLGRTSTHDLRSRHSWLSAGLRATPDGVNDAIDAQLARLGELWRRERAEARRRTAELRRALTLEERVERGLALRDLEVTETDAAPGGRTLLWVRPRTPADFDSLRVGQGDPVRLWWDDPDGEDVVRAVVSRKVRDRLAVVVDGDVPERLHEGGFRLDVDDPEATFDRGDRAIARFRELERGDLRRALRDVLFGMETARFGKVDASATVLDAALNEPQRRAVAQALAAETLSLILGPPGTGKTRTLAEVVRRAVARGERVLVTAASNTAVDNLAERLLASGAPVLRLGHPARVAPAIEAHTLDARLEAQPEVAIAQRWMREAAEIRRRALRRFERGAVGWRERKDAFAEAGRLMRDARQHVRAAQDAILAHSPIVCATAAGVDVSLLEGQRFDRVVLDEATQAPDPIALVALARAPRATLAGDPHQLPPTVLDVEAMRAGLGRTFFERLSEASPALVSMLEVQHRMHEVLMTFPSSTMYGGLLVAHESVQTHLLEDLPGVMADPLRPGPFVFVDAAGKGWTERRGGERGGDDPSTDNPGQAERVAAEVRRILSRGLAAEHLAVITPYLAEARLLRSLLAAELAVGLEIGTVDGFQGREKEAVVVDLVRSNDRSELGFLDDIRRMNVAITRARRFLLVVGDGATLARHPYYEAFFSHAERMGTWVSAWSDEAPPIDE